MESPSASALTSALTSPRGHPTVPSPNPGRGYRRVPPGRREGRREGRRALKNNSRAGGSIADGVGIGKSHTDGGTGRRSAGSGRWYTDGVGTASQKGLSVAALILVASFVASRLTGLARDVAISARFGTSPDLDAYLAAFRLPDLVFQLVAGAALGSAFIPTFASYLAQGHEREGWRVASSVLNMLMAVTAIALAFGELAAPLFVPLLVSQWPPEQQALTITLTRVMLIGPLFFCVSGMVSAILQAREHFVLPAIAPVLYNLSIAFGALALAPFFGGVSGLAMGVLIGAGLHLLVQLPGLLAVRMRYSPLILIRHPGVREVLRLMGPRIVGLAAVQLNRLVIVALASTTGEGSVSALNYAWLVTMMPVGIFGIAIGQAIFPRMSATAALDQHDRLAAMLTDGLSMALFFAIP